MPITPTRDAKRQWLVARAKGAVTLAQASGFLQSARADVTMRMCPLLFDARCCHTSMSDDRRRAGRHSRAGRGA